MQIDEQEPKETNTQKAKRSKPSQTKPSWTTTTDQPKTSQGSSQSKETDQPIRSKQSHKPTNDIKKVRRRVTLGYLRRIWLGLVGFLVVYFLKKINPNPRKKKLLSEKVAQILFSAYFFLGSVGFGLVGEFVGFITIFICFPTQQK